MVIPWVFCGVASARPWVRPPGAWYLKASYGAFHAGKYVDPGAETPVDGDDQPRFHGNSALVYGEVGVLDGIQVVGELPYTWSYNRFPGSSLRYTIDGPGSARAGLTVGVPGLKLPASVAALVRLPLFGGVERLPFDPALGEDQVDIDLVASVGGSGVIGSVPLWTAWDLGLRERTGFVLAREPDLVGDGSAVLYRGQVGWSPSFGWVQVEASGLTGQGRQSHQLALGGAHRIVSSLRFELGASVIWRAREEAAGWGWSAGLSHQRTAPVAR